MSLSATTFRIHRWLGWLVGTQVLVWVTGGVVFSLLPFKDWVKGGDSMRPPAVVLPAGWAERVAPVLRLSYRGAPRPAFVPLDGSAWSAPDEAAVRRFAAALHKGGAAATAVERLDQVPLRLGIVAETDGRTWIEVRSPVSRRSGSPDQT